MQPTVPSRPGMRTMPGQWMRVLVFVSFDGRMDSTTVVGVAGILGTVGAAWIGAILTPRAQAKIEHKTQVRRERIAVYGDAIAAGPIHRVAARPGDGPSRRVVS